MITQSKNIEFPHRTPGDYSTSVAIVSFTLGTAFFLGFKWSGNETLILLGLVYVVMAAFLNMVVLIDLLWLMNRHPFFRTQLSIRILILLSNVPLALFYFSNLFNPNLL